MKTHSTTRLASGEERRSAATARDGTQLIQASAAVMPDARAVALAQLRHQERASNSSQTAQLKERAAMISSRSAGASVPRDVPVQRLSYEELPAAEYGLGQSAAAYRHRIEKNLHPALNIATFNFVPRPRLADGGQESAPSFGKTEASTGIGDYVVASQKTQAEKKINTSHSEHQFISNGLHPMMESEDWPSKYVIDWVYTERPACHDVWYGQKFIAKGCNTELQEVEDLQKQRRWDGTKIFPFATRDDLNIRVYSSFSSSASASIARAVKFAPVRIEALSDLKYKLISLYQGRYADDASGEYDLTVFENDIPAKAFDDANEALPSWDDYDEQLTVPDYKKELEKEGELLLGTV